jgi:hypothetical protein
VTSRYGNEIAMTLEEHRELMAVRTRPVTDLHMSNSKAQQWRLDTPATPRADPINAVLDALDNASGDKWTRIDTVVRGLNAAADDRQRPDCGTTAGYSLHLRHGERTCPSCREAHRLYRMEQGRQRRLAS